MARGRWAKVGPAIVMVFLVGPLTLGARRQDGACGGDPRRVEPLVQGEIGGALRFQRASTTTHSVGRPLFFEPGTFDTPATQGLRWYGDDYSRLVVLESALPVEGGRATTGRWAEYAWGAQELFPGVPLAGQVFPELDFPVSTVRSVDIGVCSQHLLWTNPSTGCGTMDTLLRGAAATSVEQYFPFPPVPGYDACVGGISFSARGAPTWNVEIGTRTEAPGGTSDRVCVNVPLHAASSIDCLANFGVPFPFFWGCAYDAASLSLCGTFGTTDAGAGHRDPVFTMTDFSLDPGPGGPNGPRACLFPATIEPYIDLLRNAVRDSITSEIRQTLTAAVTQRETTVSGRPPAGSCNAPPTAIVFRSNCAQPDDGLTPDQDCAAFATGDPTSTAVRASCEARESTERCQTDADCGGSGLRRYCHRLNTCGGDPARSLCTADSDCQQQQRCLPTITGRCADTEPVCYWNIEVDRIEMMPSGLEIVLAEDADDETYRAFETIGVLEFLSGDGGFCRPAQVPAFSAAPTLTGTLGPTAGALLP